MKKVLLLAVVLLISGLSFAQTLNKPFFPYKEEGYSINELTNLFSRDLNSPQTQWLYSFMKERANQEGWIKYFPNMTAANAIYFFNKGGIDTTDNWKLGEATVFAIAMKDNTVVVSPDRTSLSNRIKGITGPEPAVAFNSGEMLRKEFGIDIGKTETVCMLLKRCGNGKKDKNHFIQVKPTPEMPVVQQVQNQQMCSDTNIYNITVEVPANVGNSTNVTQDDGASMAVYSNQDYYNNNFYAHNVSRFGPSSIDPYAPVENIGSFRTANAIVEKQYGAFDGNMWSNTCNYDINQGYGYPNAGFSNTASYGNASAGAYFSIFGTATTVPVVTYDPNVYYNGHLRQANNNNNGGRVLQQRRGTNQMQNNQQQNQNQRIAENKNAKSWDGNMW